MKTTGTDFEVVNKTVLLTVPTQGSVSVMSIAGWVLWMHRYLPSGFNWNLTWNDYRHGFGASDSDDFWMGLERVQYARSVHATSSVSQLH